MITETIKHITMGQTKRLYKPVGYTMLANFINIVPFCLSVEVINTLFKAFDGTGTPLNISKLWGLIVIMFVYIIFMISGEEESYNVNFREAYNTSAEGRIVLAEHLRKLSLGFLYKKNSGGLSPMLITDFTMTEQGMSHHLPQLLSALVMPILAFLGLLFVDWQISIAMFLSLPISFLIPIFTFSIQKKLGQAQILAKIRANSRMEEYLRGIRVIKTYNMTGIKFIRLQEVFNDLKRVNIKTEALIGSIVTLPVTLPRMGLTLMILCGTYLLTEGKPSVAVFVMFLIVGSRVSDPLTLVLTNLAEFRHYSIAGERTLNLLNEPEMSGTQDAPEQGDIIFRSVSFGYNDKYILHDISVAMKQGSLAVIVGPSENGKSTLTKPCARFYDPDKGIILLGNKSIREIDPEKLM